MSLFTAAVAATVRVCDGGRETVREIGIRKVGRKWKIVVHARPSPPPADRPEGSFVTLYYVENIRSTENTNFPFQKLPRPNPCLSSSHRHPSQHRPSAIANTYNIIYPYFIFITTLRPRRGRENRIVIIIFRHRHVVILC